MRFKIGDFVSKPVTGVCEIEDIVSLDLTEKKREQIILSDAFYGRYAGKNLCSGIKYSFKIKIMPDKRRGMEFD